MTEPPTPEQQALRYAIEFMTVFVGADFGDVGSIEEAASYIEARLVGPDAVPHDQLILGQLLFGQAVLFALAASCDVAPENYRAFASDWLRHHGPALGNLQP